jgi:hypothetical protein
VGVPIHERGPRPTAPGETRLRPQPQVTPQAGVAALAAAAGNQAVARLLQREEDAGTTTAAPIQFGFPKRPPPPPNLNLDPDYMTKTQDAIQGRVRDYLAKQREVLLQLIAKGMPITELVDRVRVDVPDATKLALEQIEQIVRSTFDGVQIPSHRPSGVSGWDNSELAAIVRNVMGVPTKLEISQPHGWVKLSVSGYEVGLRKGDKEISAEAGWDKSFGMKGKVGPVHFGGVVKPPATPGGNITWEAELAFPEEGAMVPMLDGLGGMMGTANRSMTRLAGDALSDGKMPTTDQISAGVEPIKEAMRGLTAIAKASKPSFGVRVTGDGPGITVQATLTVPF